MPECAALATVSNGKSDLEIQIGLKIGTFSIKTLWGSVHESLRLMRAHAKPDFESRSDSYETLKIVY